MVRWPGSEIRACGVVGGGSWEPVAGACWYPVDLERAPGPLEVFRQRQGRREFATLEVTAYPYPTEKLTLKDDRHVNLSPADLARSQREQALVSKVLRLLTPLRFELPLGAPLSALPQAGRFGSRRVFNGQPRSPHSGADFRATVGTPVFAAADGRVALAGEHFFSGNSVFLDHGDGLISMSFHLSKISVAEGAEVKRGEKIGEVGATGRVTGPHLHFGLRWHGARIDPMLLLGPVAEVPSLPN
ncbi:MAG: M23 family metallopeptidase [Thermoanaerobaculia bacterium]